MTYFACQIKDDSGYRMSALKIVPPFEIKNLKPLQWRQTDIVSDEFRIIEEAWKNKCKPKYNWTIERWMVDLNKCIKECRQKMSKKINQLQQELEILYPIEEVQTIKPISPIEQTEVVEILEPIGANSKYRDGIRYDKITNESEPTKRMSDIISEEVKEFMARRFTELSEEFGITINCIIDFNLEFYFDDL